MKKIKLIRGKFAIVDNEDFPYLSRFNWSLGKTGHATRQIKGNYVELYMEFFIKQKSKGERYLFKNRNPLDLRKENILVTNFGVSSAFSKKTSSETSSRFKGVYWDKRAKKWIAYLTARIGDKRVKLLWQSFDNEKEAALARNKKAIEIFGQYAYQNKI